MNRHIPIVATVGVPFTTHCNPTVLSVLVEYIMNELKEMSAVEVFFCLIGFTVYVPFKWAL